MTFNEYIRTAEITNDAEGDLIGDARSDSRMPEITSLDHLIKYLHSRHACDEAIEIAPVVWEDYLKSA